MNNELISRQAAIDAVEKSMYENPHENEIHRGMHDHEHRYFLTILMRLPSVQPEIEPIDYTDKGKYLRACGFAISQMIERGSSAVVFSIHSDHPVQVRYEDVLEWIDKQLDVIGYSKDGNVSGVEEAEKGR